MLPDQASYDSALHATLTELGEFLEATEAMLADADLSDETIVVNPPAAMVGFYRKRRNEEVLRHRDESKSAAHAMMQMAQDFANRDRSSLPSACLLSALPGSAQESAPVA